MFTSWKMSFCSPPLSRLPPTAPRQVAGKPKPTPCCVTLHLKTGIKGWPTGMLGYQSRGNGRCSGGIKKGCTRFDVSKQLKGHVNNFNRELETTEKFLTWQLSKLPKHFKLNITTDAFSGFPGGPVVKNPPANAWDMGSINSISAQGRSHVPQLRSLCSGVQEPQPLSPHDQSLCSATSEVTKMRSPRTATKSSPCSLQLEKARAQQPGIRLVKKQISKSLK